MRVVPPSRGEVWLVQLDPTRGHEPKGARPALVISADSFNQTLAGLVVAIPMTTREKRVRTHVKVEPPQAGLKAISFIKCEDICSLTTERFVEAWGRVEQSTMTQVEDILRMLLDL